MATSQRHGRRRGQLLAALALAMVGAVMAASVAHGSGLMALDLGSEFLKVSLVKPGRTPISVVVNEMSRRKSPALVGFTPEGERLLGEEAFSFAVRYPTSVFARARDLLAKPASDPSIASMLRDHSLPYTVVQHSKRGLAGVTLPSGAELTAEELVVSWGEDACVRLRAVPASTLPLPAIDPSEQP
jgi:hypoxia up-regulated 1